MHNCFGLTNTHTHTQGKSSLSQKPRMAGKHLLVTVRVWDPFVALDSELNWTSLCSFCSHYTYRAEMPFFLWLRHIFYCISQDGWCAADTEIYRPLARSGRALRRVFWRLTNTLEEENKSWHFMGSEWEGRRETRGLAMKARMKDILFFYFVFVTVMRTGLK